MVTLSYHSDFTLPSNHCLKLVNVMPTSTKPIQASQGQENMQIQIILSVKCEAVLT